MIFFVRLCGNPFHFCLIEKQERLLILCTFSYVLEVYQTEHDNYFDINDSNKIVQFVLKGRQFILYSVFVYIHIYTRVQ